MTSTTTTDAMRCFNMSLLSALLLDTSGPMYKCDTVLCMHCSFSLLTFSSEL